MLIATRTLLALFASYSWSMVYPYAAFDRTGDFLWAGFFLIFLLLFFSVPRRWRRPAIAFGIVSALAGLIATTWSALAWRTGVWMPEFPPVLHQLFSTDGEASYNASDGQLFLVVFAVLATTTMLIRHLMAWQRSRKPFS